VLRQARTAAGTSKSQGSGIAWLSIIRASVAEQ
jgi:hypothetical protein